MSGFAPAEYDFVKHDDDDDDRIVQGSTFSVALQLTDSDIPFDGMAARGQFRRNYAQLSGTEVLAELTCVILDPEFKTMQVSLTAEQTAAILTADEGVWDVEVFNDMGTVYMTFQGIWKKRLETTV